MLILKLQKEMEAQKAKKTRKPRSEARLSDTTSAKESTQDYPSEPYQSMDTPSQKASANRSKLAAGRYSSLEKPPKPTPQRRSIQPSDSDSAAFSAYNQSAYSLNTPSVASSKLMDKFSLQEMKAQFARELKLMI